MGYLIAGRLKESGFPVENKHPAILPINHHISTLPDIDETFDAAKQALTQYFAPQKSTEFEVYKFRQAKQESRPAIQKWLDSSKGTRHTAGHKLPGPRPNKPSIVELSPDTD